MSHLQFDERGLVEALERLSLRLRTAFAAACAERLLPAYTRFSDRSGRGAPSELASMLERLWRDLEGDEMSPDGVERNIERCDMLTPREDDGEWIEGQSQAEDAAAALTYAFECRRNGGAQEAAWAGRRAYTALDEFVITRDEIDPHKPGAEERVLSDPLIQAEFARQRRDLEELLRVRQECDVAGVVDRMRDRARAEAPTVFG